MFKKDYEEGMLCHLNKGVICNDAKCDTCGWNPIVADARLKKIERRLKARRRYAK